MEESTTTTTKGGGGPLDMEAILAPMKETHKSQKNYTLEWRRENLRKIKRMLHDNRMEICEALKQDLGKGPVEAWLTEPSIVSDEIDFILHRLRRWMAPNRVSTPVHSAIGFSQTRKVPLLEPGVLVIGPSNYPILLTIAPAVGAIAAGNPVVIKPSDVTPVTAKLLKRLVDETVNDPGVLQVVLTDVDGTTQLLKQQWGKVCFTGSTRVGRIVAEATAKTLTPSILELGGKAPLYVDNHIYNLHLVAHRLIFGKTLNAGQTCVAIDYVLIHEDIAEKLLELMKKAVEVQFPGGPNSELGRMARVSHAQRQVEMLEEVEQCDGTEILCGGSKQCIPDQRYIAPTVVLNPPLNSRLMTEEIFGPVMAVRIVKSREDAKQFILNNMPKSPLALYVFTTSNACYEDFVKSIPSGCVCRNDSIVQFGNNKLPVGGIGTSGWGNHRGKYSFHSFSHERNELHRFLLTDLGLLRYHPFAGIKERIVEFVLRFVFDTPVLHLRWWPAIAIPILLWVVLPDHILKGAILDGIATALEQTAQWLRNS